MKTFNSFLIIVESGYRKKFAFFVPIKFEATFLNKPITQLAFYYINDDQLITCTRSKDFKFLPADYLFIWISGVIQITNDRKDLDFVLLNGNYWFGMEQGNDGYPMKDEGGDFLIGGGQYPLFRATKIEIFGANI